MPSSDWLATANHSKPIIALYLQIFATVTFKLTIAKIGKYGIMIGWLRSAETSQSECGKMLRFATVEVTSGRCLIYRVFGVWSAPRLDADYSTLIAGKFLYKDMASTDPLNELLCIIYENIHLFKRGPN